MNSGISVNDEELNCYNNKKISSSPHNSYPFFLDLSTKQLELTVQQIQERLQLNLLQQAHIRKQQRRFESDSEYNIEYDVIENNLKLNQIGEQEVNFKSKLSTIQLQHQLSIQQQELIQQLQLVQRQYLMQHRIPSSFVLSPGKTSSFICVFAFFFNDFQLAFAVLPLRGRLSSSNSLLKILSKYLNKVSKVYWD